ncbi:hypothetical protein [Micromonospora aurantiaca (nom. illeg.)]|uniref:hypothetical protein n=1 Tax=Micromonospora aurantiaca (nom. illeg.) TaxID=47850 RepID=UPI00340396B0
MGARLVSLVLARWTHLSDRAFRVVVKMAHTALDEPNDSLPAATYFGGRDPLVDVLRNERGGDRQTAYRTVKRAIAELLDDTAIERVSAGRAGKNAVYRLTLLNTPASIEQGHCTVAVQGDTSGPPEGDTQSPPQGDTSGSVRGTAGVPPRNHDEPREEPREEVRRTVLPVDQAVDTTGGHAGPQTPLRPGDPPGRRTSPETATSAAEQQPPQPETATHDRAPASDPPPALRLVPGNPDATPTENRPSLFPAAVPSQPGSPLRRASRAAQAIAEATARRQAAIAAHRAREAAGE